MAEFTLRARASCSDGVCGVRLNITKQQVEDLPPLGHTG
jgi:hypothetical protein